MELRNHTPFTPLIFHGVDTQDREFGVAVLRGDFHVDVHGRLRPTPDEAKIYKTDTYTGKPGHSSLYYESDLVPFKPRTDILAHGDAFPPDGRPRPGWPVSLRVGNTEKALFVTGPRRVRRGRSGKPILDEPTPSDRVALRYELAFGGADAAGAYTQNPIGRGYSTHSQTDAWGPQIESPDAPITDLHAAHEPAGFGPIARNWQPRLARAGTYDEHWRQDRAPRLPHDFSFDYYNCAPPGLTTRFLVGDEEVVAVGLGRPGRHTFRLPGLGAIILGQFRDGRHALAPMFLDTLWIDFTHQLVRLTWRGTFAAHSLARLALLCVPTPTES